ncbi:MAG: UbiD family decarboxylase [Chloroflexota bacterium]
MGYKDFRDFLKQVDKYGELKRFTGVDWNLEMGSITELIYHEGKTPHPALLFDEIPGYPKGYTCLMGQLSSMRRLAIALGLPENQVGRKDIIQNWRKKLKKMSTLVPPKVVTSAPVMANKMTGDKIDLLKFPVPKFHEHDGGRYMGTGHAVIQQDPETGYVNLGIYRVMLVDRKRLVIHILEGQHGSLIMNDKYFARGKPMPVAIAMGMDPALWFASDKKVPWQTSEYDYAGMLKGKPMEVFIGPKTGLPLPATAEIVIEGECRPGDLANEGPFGEGNGYYANLGLEPVPEPVMRVSAIYYRDNPILTCAIPSVPPAESTPLFAFTSSVSLWDRLEAAGIPGIKDVWCPEVGHGSMLQVIAIEQKYSGHSTEVGMIASQTQHGICKYTIVVDDDIDPSNWDDVLWAIETRTDPARSLQIIRNCHTTSRDITISPEEKKKYKVPPKPLYMSKCIIDACQPFEWKKDWYPVDRSSPALRAKIIKKYGAVMKNAM